MMTEAYRTLLIEDNPADARLVKEMLAGEERIPLALENARSLAEASQRLRTETFDAVLVDLGLPDSRGIETFHRLQAAAPDVPALILTGSDDIDLAIAAVQAGAQDYLLKSQISGGPLARAVQYAIERKRAEQAVRRAKRLYEVLSRVNEAVVRVRTLPELYQTVCRVAVETGKLKVAWVGIVDDTTREVEPAGQFGMDEEYLRNLRVTLDSTERGIGPTGRAIRDRKPYVCNDWESAAEVAPWRAEGAKRGFRSSAAFPLDVNGRVVGALTLYAGDRNFFTADEVELLTTLTNDLAFAIESFERDEQRRAAEAALRQLNAELEERVRSRTAALVAANRELEAFTYSVSHDLRAPLRAIDGFSRILADQASAQLDGESKQLLQRIRNATKRMSGLIDDLLSLSRIGRQELHLADTDLSAIARSVAAELRDGDRSRDVEFVIPEGIRGSADPALMRIVLQNLLSNAWKFTSKQPSARVEFGMTDAREYFVRDDGVGFDVTYADKLFVPFQRLHPHDFDGTGVGLATVQRVIHRHGGTVRADARPGKGATFFFTLGGATA